MAKIQDVAFDGNNLFDPSSIMVIGICYDHRIDYHYLSMKVQQEDLLMTRMKQLNLFPVISMYSFIYHYKSATVKVLFYGILVL